MSLIYLGTTTPNQKLTPGMAVLHEWKRSLKWLDKVFGVEKMTDFEREELMRAMERGSMSLFYFSGWHSEGIFSNK
jgi:hypothetical protein